ncbi:hypothetical protein UFOVP1655_92 [uncultured Caudovirales phage]|jgi:hypothetical protein|uniref:Uncharacterized protein n=1 Tax=uncultured Caudovirales phage TaxID=2100421 RepID=A0A6J5T463_9CAUD|nr:hypothetical protein UFOVP1655_92 [uncultured Caudovirales phage]
MTVEKILKGAFIVSTFAWVMMTMTLILTVVFGLGLL